MTKSSLPSQIIVLLFAAFLTVQALLWFSLHSVRDAMNANAAEESLQRMEGRLKTLQEQVSLIASDYHNWTDIYLNAQSLDYKRLASNYGITAERGDVFQYAELYDGPFPKPIGWREGQGLAPQQGFVNELTRSKLRDLVRHLDAEERETVNYFEMRDGLLVMFSSSYLLPEDEDLISALHKEGQAVAVIGKALEEEHLVNIAAEFAMRGLRVVDEPQSTGAVTLPTIGVFDEPVAWLEWHPPKPGTVLFQKMAPIMTSISLIFAVVFCGGARLLRDRAVKLIAQEAVSFKQARTDVLTELPNRLALREHLALLTADGTLNCAIVAMDLNNFKRINDNAGHVGGDLFLKTFGSRLGTLSCKDTFVARLGGDEFVLVISTNDPLEQTVTMKCAGLAKVSRDQIECGGLHFDVTAAKGLAMQCSNEFHEDELLRRADRALYVAKARGAQEVVVYDDQMALEDRVHMEIESRMRLALIDGDGFSIVYQPIVAASGMSEVLRYEALARWSCSDFGQVPPDKFIHVAETSGLIVHLGWLLLDMICNDIRGLGKCRVGVNISPVQLMSPHFADLFAARVKANGVRPEQIEVEVTEQIVVHNDAKISQELTILRDHGFSLALDDFGTGYASIGYLTRMPFHILKIDRSFARLQVGSKQFQRMVSSIMGLAHAIDLQIIAEGIETSEEALRFRALGADYLQGYHFGHPVQMNNNFLEEPHMRRHPQML